jgi:hypothetical protein
MHSLRVPNDSADCVLVPSVVSTCHFQRHAAHPARACVTDLKSHFLFIIGGLWANRAEDSTSLTRSPSDVSRHVLARRAELKTAANPGSWGSEAHPPDGLVVDELYERRAVMRNAPYPWPG